MKKPAGAMRAKKAMKAMKSSKAKTAMKARAGMKAMKVATKARMARPAAATKAADKKKDDAKKNHDDKKKDNDVPRQTTTRAADVQTTTRADVETTTSSEVPSWIVTPFRLPNGRVEVCQLEGRRWIMTEEVALECSIGGLLERMSDPGCDEEHTYTPIGIAVCVCREGRRRTMTGPMMTRRRTMTREQMTRKRTMTTRLMMAMTTSPMAPALRRHLLMGLGPQSLTNARRFAAE